jgi:hypothetical protein
MSTATNMSGRNDVLPPRRCSLCGAPTTVVNGTTTYDPTREHARSERIEEAAQEVLAADGAIAREEPGADRRWDAALAALDAALEPEEPPR